ncbi:MULTISPECIES: haloacid dehalogenase-like hydrolase [unclassified Streptomyces]|uniref:HAD family hydrolase n=1 Tax=Streptomycetaceae TaxID=2062 RepID=UPI002E793086|nr:MULTISPECIES: haloacid dehalogenase-like hydrolase [unclassified Streptomyces]MED7953976.1 haloacid dehalogenase-like hydrolase [Streptomyces sp. BE303]MEE1822689.1 haloacid dehalogenase-like hydrolase [Streptomyces sp. BE20]
MPLIILWDIDHTLIENAGVSKEIYAAAFAALAGYPPNHAARTEGRTDRLIMREMFRRNDRPEPDWPTVQTALEVAGIERFDDLRRRGTALPGVRAALEAAADRPGWVSSVLTGNIAANARVKLAAFGLDDLLDLAVGAYGADAVQRRELVAVARERARRHRGLPVDVPVVLVGDTPRDVEAALTSEAGVIAVATGVDSQADLIAAGASTVLPDLSDTPALLKLLRSFASD